MNIIDIENYIRLVLKINIKSISRDEILTKCVHPNHVDNNPSFYINKNTGLFNCRSCGFHGNLQTLSTLILGYDRSNKILNTILGKDGHEDEFLRNKIKLLTTEKDKVKEDEFNESSYNYYVNNFNKEILLSNSIASKIKIYLTTPLLKKYDIRHWTLSGTYYNRIAIPIKNISGEILNINFRKIVETDKIKYLCLPGSSSKVKLSDTLFYSQNCVEYLKNVGKKLPYVVITEGCFDSIFLGENGIYSVSIFSNIISKNQLNLLQNITDYPITFLDTDKQGLSGQSKTINYTKNFINIYSLFGFDNDLDPDEIDTKEVKSKIQKVLENNS